MDLELRPQLPLIAAGCAIPEPSPERRAERRRDDKHRASAAKTSPAVRVLTCVSMRGWDGNRSSAAVPSWMCFGRADALTEPQICYVSDGILFSYGIISTALYCRVKIYNAREASSGKGKQNVEEGIYTGSTPHKQDTYETIGMKK